MPSHNLRFTFLLAASLAFGLSMGEQAPPPQGKTVEESMKQNAAGAPPDASLGQATLLMQQGKNEEALKFLEASLRRTRRGAEWCGKSASPITERTIS